MERETAEYDDIRTVTHRDGEGGQLIAIHCVSTCKSMIAFGSPLLMAELTEAEAVDIVDEFADSVGQLFAEMRIYLDALRSMRGGQ